MTAIKFKLDKGKLLVLFSLQKQKIKTNIFTLF